MKTMLSICLCALLPSLACSSSSSERPAATPSSEPYQGEWQVVPEEPVAPGTPGSPQTPSVDPNEPASGPAASGPRSAADEVPPVGHGGDDADLRISRGVREKLMADDRLSFTSKNIEIVTQAGTVTLRGAVPNATESKTIEQCARDVAGVKQVDNQLVVAP